jgi:hypothetical protein
MDPRFMFSAMAGVFCVVLIFATVTTVRHLSDRADPAVTRALRDRPATENKKTARRRYVTSTSCLYFGFRGCALQSKVTPIRVSLRQIVRHCRVT